MQETLYAYCMRTRNPALLYQWDSERNNANTPKTISYGSKKKVWWQCSEGHVWQASICSRTSSGAGCPYCAGKFPLIGENDFATRFPYLAAQWHPTCAVASHQKFSFNTGASSSRQSSRCMVDLRTWTYMAGSNQIQSRRMRLSNLCQS